jgi:hypothetical protein
MIWTQMAVILVNFLTATSAKYIDPLAAVAAIKRKFSTQNLTEAEREQAGPLLNRQMQILS